MTPVTDDELAMLRAVRENPDDDLPRLVYADWLEERGDFDSVERAAVIRLMCHPLADRRYTLPVGAALDWPHYYDGGKLGFEHVAELTYGYGINPRPVRRVVFGDEPGTPRVEWYRGFVEAVTCPAAAWLEYGDAVLERHPVTQVTLTAWTIPSELDFEASERGVTATLAGRTVELPRSAFWPPGATTYAEADRLRDNAVAAALAARWPGVSFAMPPGPHRHPRDATGRWVADGPAELQARSLFARFAVPPELLGDASAANYAAAVVAGSPTAPTPQGVFDVAEAAARRSERPGHSRRDSAPAARTRFPRPR